MTDVKTGEPDELDPSRAPLLDHLIELRKRLIWSFLSLGVAFGICFAFVDPIFSFLVKPLLAAGHDRMIFTGVMEAFFTRVKIAFFGAIMIAFPIIAMQIWLFVAPGLYAKEKRAFRPFLLMTPLFFLAGAALAYYGAMPVALHFLLGYEGDLGGVHQEALPAVGLYLDFVTKFLFGFGVSFLLPVLLMLLARAGILTRQQLQKGRRYAIVAAFIIAAVLTPPDVISQLLLAIPLWMLYEASIFGIWLTERRQAKAAAKSGVPAKTA